jgi:predicted small lipoprotein YifL
MFRWPLISSLALLTIAACGERGPVDKSASKTAGLPDINATAPSAGGEAHGSTRTAAAMPAAAGRIPAAFQGRWGLAPADCTTTRGDAKGLMIVTADELRFYESRAVPTSGVAADQDSIRGDFTFAGEGQNWTRFEALKMERQMLVRTETNPSASFSYAKCS